MIGGEIPKKVEGTKAIFSGKWEQSLSHQNLPKLNCNCPRPPTAVNAIHFSTAAGESVAIFSAVNCIVHDFHIIYAQFGGEKNMTGTEYSIVKVILSDFFDDSHHFAEHNYQKLLNYKLLKHRLQCIRNPFP